MVTAVNEDQETLQLNSKRSFLLYQQWLATVMQEKLAAVSRRDFSQASAASWTSVEDQTLGFMYIVELWIYCSEKLGHGLLCGKYKTSV